MSNSQEKDNFIKALQIVKDNDSYHAFEYIRQFFWFLSLFTMSVQLPQMVFGRLSLLPIFAINLAAFAMQQMLNMKYYGGTWKFYKSIYKQKKGMSWVNKRKVLYPENMVNVYNEIEKECNDYEKSILKTLMQSHIQNKYYIYNKENRDFYSQFHDFIVELDSKKEFSDFIDRVVGAKKENNEFKKFMK